MSGSQGWRSGWTPFMLPADCEALPPFTFFAKPLERDGAIRRSARSATSPEEDPSRVVIAGRRLHDRLIARPA